MVSAACYANRFMSSLLSRHREGAALVIILLLFTSACGYIGYPMVPLANIPNRVADLAAVQRGSTIIVHFSLPTLTTENLPVGTALNLDLRIAQAGTPFQPAEWATQAKPTAQPDEIKGGIVTYKLPAAAWAGKTVALAARTGGNGKLSDWSNYEIFRVIPAPETPSKPTVENTPQGERITWNGAGDQFRVLRRVGDEKDFSVAANVTSHEWTDTPLDYGKPYTYMVQALVDVGNKRLTESDLSPAADDTPKDTFPPAVPSGLHADQSGAGVSLVWDPDSDADLAGYRIYRSEGNGAWQKLGDGNAVPSYSDTTGEHGKTYRYAVSAFDKSTNESGRSAAVEVVFP